jgi:tetratricopeptide (TPR) repeat protein
MNAEDFGAHYELGYRHLRLGELDEAIKSLQKGRNDLQNRWRAMLYLGVAFWRKKNFPLAEKNLSDAIDAVGSVNEEGRKEILYYRGRVAQDMGDLPRALSHFNDIAAIDYEYKDVARRIDEITAAS